MTATRTTEVTEPVSYQLGAGSAAGVWLGFGFGRVALVGIGLVVSVVTLTVGAPALLAVLPVTVSLCLGLAQLNGRPLLAWLPPITAYHAATLTGDARWHPPIPSAASDVGADRDGRLRLPAEFGKPTLCACPGDPSIGLVLDRPARTVTVVFEVAGLDRFPLLDPADRDGLVAGWGQTLAVLADTDDTLNRLQVIERAGHTPSVDLSTRGGPDGAADRVEDYASLRREIEALAATHCSRLAIQWSLGRVDTATLGTLATRCRAVSRSLLSARLVTRPLTVAEISQDLTVTLRGPEPDLLPGAAPGPVSRKTTWTQVTTDDTCHRSYAVTTWPTTPVTADWLAPLLLTAPAGVTRTVAIHLERVTPAAAARTARTTRAKAALDQRDRVRLGMTTSAAVDRAESSGIEMDSELAAGYRTHRITGIVTLSGASPGILDDAGRVLRQAAAASRVELRPLHGQHDQGLAATVPLCRARPGAAT